MWIIGCDFHPRYHQIAALNRDTDELVEPRLSHEGKEAAAFYEALPRGALIGMEATCTAQWFERLLERCGHTLRVGDAAQIRASVVRKQKTDTRDALHVLDLLLTDRFPKRLDTHARRARCATVAAASAHASTLADSRADTISRAGSQSRPIAAHLVLDAHGTPATRVPSARSLGPPATPGLVVPT